MKFGMNLLLWTGELNDGMLPVLEQLKKIGYDGVEVPIFGGDPATFRPWAKRLDDLGFERTAVTIRTDADNPISPDAKIRAAGVEATKRTLDCCHALGATSLCGHGGTVEDRMVVLELGQAQAGVDLVGPVQGDEQGPCRLDRLQSVHPIGNRGAAGVRGDQVVPARACARVARQHSFVGVQRGRVALIADRAQDLALCRAGVSQHAQRLIAVRRHDHTVEQFRAAVREDFHVRRAARCLVGDDLVHGRGELDAMGERRGEGLDVAS